MAKKEKKEKKSKAEKKEKKEKKSRRRRKEEQEGASRIPKTAYDTVLSTLGGVICFTAVLSFIVLLLIFAYAVVVSL